MTILTVALPVVRPTAGTEFSYVFSDDGSTVRSHGVAVLALLPQARQLHLVVPIALLSWLDLKLPPVAGARLRLALDGMLEDRLLDEPAQLALALAPQRSPDGRSVVAACDKGWLTAVLAFFEQANRPATRVVPEFAPSGNGEPAHRLCVTGGAEQPWLCLVSPFDCLSLPLGQAPLLLQQAGGAFDAAPLQAEPEVAGIAEQVLGRAVQVVPRTERLLACSTSLWELAQFDLAQSGRDRMARRWATAWQQFLRAPVWRPARWALVLLLIANLIGLNAWAWRQDSALVAKRMQVRQVLTQTFPRVRTVVDAPVQMARELTALRQSSGAVATRDLEVLLGALGAALPPERWPAAIDFSAEGLTAVGLALDTAQAAQAVTRLTGAGFAAHYEGGRLTVRVLERS